MILRITTAATALFASIGVFAQSSPWLSEPGSSTVSFAYITQETDELKAGNNTAALPDDLSQDTYFLSYEYGLSDSLQLNLETSYSEAELPPVSPSSRSDLGDSRVSLSWRVHDEFLSDGAPTVTLRAGATIAGSYETDAVNAIGEGADGIEASVIVGKILNQYLSLSGEAGYRVRSDDTPDETFYNLNAYLSITPNFYAFASLITRNSRDGLDIGGPGFSPARFNETKIEEEIFSFGVSYRLSPSLGLNAQYFDTRGDRNVPLYDGYAIGTSFSF